MVQGRGSDLRAVAGGVCLMVDIEDIAAHCELWVGRKLSTKSYD